MSPPLILANKTLDCISERRVMEQGIHFKVLAVEHIVAGDK